MICRDTLAEAVIASRDLLIRYIAGFNEDNRTHQASNMPNHIIWTLGHCALTMNRVAERLDGRPLPACDYVTGDGAGGDAERFDTESVCFDSTPRDEPEIYPSLERGEEVYAAACDRLAAAVRGAEDADLDQMIQWIPQAIPMWRLVFRVSFHNGTHAGQIVDLRRSLGLDRVIKPQE